MPMKQDDSAKPCTAGSARDSESPCFSVHGAASWHLPVLVSVPHAGRNYPDSLLQRARVPLGVIRRLEDRYVDMLATDAIDRGCSAIIAHTARAVIDLNRDPRDIETRMIADFPDGVPVIQSAKQRGGLGLFPKSLPRSGDLWRGAVSWEEAKRRIDEVHVPYHGAIARRISEIRQHFGKALLIDIHSMPPLDRRAGGERRPDFVIGDRFGSSASSRFADLARSCVADAGYHCAVNHPYPGYFLLERHGRPSEGVHALQVEVSRDLYLDDSLDKPGTGLPAIRSLLAELIETLGEEALDRDLPIAAE